MQHPVMCMTPHIDNLKVYCTSCNTIKTWKEVWKGEMTHKNFPCSIDFKIEQVPKYHCANCKVIQPDEKVYDPYSNCYIKCACGYNDWIPMIN